MGARSHLAAGLVAVAAAGALLSCGGGGNATTERTPAADAASLARKAFGRNPAARSGRIDGSIRITVKGVAAYREPVTMSVNGPYRHRPGSTLPDYAIDMGVRDRGVTLTSLGGRSYVSLGSTGYEIPAAARRGLVASSAKGHNGLTRTLEQFGIAPWRWEIDKRVGPTETVDGVPSVRVDTGVDVAAVLRDANTLAGLLDSLGLARANALPAQIPAAARRVLATSVTSAKGTSWIGRKDGVMRRARMTIAFKIGKSQRPRVGGISALTVAAAIRVTDVGTAPRIRAPETLSPFSSFELALEALAEDARR